MRIMAPPDAAAEICCPFTVIAEPGIKVWEPKRKLEAASWLMVWEPKTMGPAGGLLLIVGSGGASVEADPSADEISGN